MSEGEKILVLPDMKLLQKDEYGMWSLHKEPCSSMPDIKAAVQQFDRFYGICDNMTYVSVKGNCTDFTLPEQSPEADGWSMVTNDEGGFTAIAAFDGKVAVFTQNDLITLKGNELPFTLSYDADCGCYSQDAVAVCEGVLYFASRNGIMSYSKNTLKCISRSFEKGIDYSKVRLANVNGAIAVALNNGENVRIYEPASGQWSLLSVGGKNVFVTGTNLIVPNGEYSSLYKMTDSYGEFSFKVALENIGRRRIKSVTVTAEVGEGARLSLSDGKGGELFSISSSDGDTVSRTYYPRGAYFDYGELSFDGKGNVKLYGIFIEYECIRNVS